MRRARSLTVPDGFWIIAFGVTGLVGLASLVVMMLLPLVLTLRRFPVATWSDPRVGPAVGLALLLALTMIDYLSNAMMNPIYALAMGGLVGQSAVRLGGRRREAEASLRRRVRPDGRGPGGPGRAGVPASDRVRLGLRG